MSLWKINNMKKLRIERENWKTSKSSTLDRCSENTVNYLLGDNVPQLSYLISSILVRNKADESDLALADVKFLCDILHIRCKHC